jgi:HAD superfamily hydrolase (TIGR01450 family)
MKSGDPIRRGMFDRVEFVLCDLDGVVWLARQPIPGAPEAIARLRASGRRVLFVTNNSVAVVADQEQALADIGVPAIGDVLTSAQAAATLLAAHDRVAVVGGEGIREAVSERASMIDLGVGRAPDVVMVGLARDFDYRTLYEASAAIRSGARFIATNDDATFPTPHGVTPGAGSIVAAVATAAGVQPTVAGKPNAPMGDLVRRECGPRFNASTALMIGDRWSTDGAFARVLGCPFALVRSGVTRPGDAVGGVADIDAADLTVLADLLVGGRR